MKDVTKKYTTTIRGHEYDRKLTSQAARVLSRARRTHAGGRPPKPTRCRRCGAKCASARGAWRHCSVRA